jgi:hypothetical protein
MTVSRPFHSGEISHNKIGGWLILFAIGIVLYPVGILISIFTELLPAFFHENWSVLTTPGSKGYHPLWTPMLLAELIGNICFFFFSICLVVFFFQRRKLVTKLAVLFLLSNLIFVGFDYLLTQFVLMNATSVNLDTTINLIRTGVASVIWIPYFILSKRVKGTFIN